MPGFTPGFVGAIQAMETIRLLLGWESPLLGKLVLFDGFSWEWTVLETERDPLCGECRG